MPWILLLLSLFIMPLHAATIPGVTSTSAAPATSETAPAAEPDLEQKKAAYGALADVLENTSSREELIGQLRKVAATPPPEPVPTIAPPEEVAEEKTVLENVQDVGRHYGQALSSRFAQLYRNITGSPHKTFNPQTFINAAGHFLLLAGLVFVFYWLVRLCAFPLYRRMGKWGRRKNHDRANWLQLPAMIVGAFIIDL
ncbi:MAG: mechanosensitive channel protein, partial [Enterobacteriaceae bacterium]|nr:mechanosensitive channel protein [Enterobacteriaceae bacterium]